MAQPYNAAGEMIFELELPSTVKQIRIDPAMLQITEPKFVVVNGRSTIDKEQGVVTAAFATADPNIYIRVSDRVKSTGNAFSMTMQTVMLPDEMAKSLEKELRKKIRL